jgi:hypothetical protein
MFTVIVPARMSRRVSVTTACSLSKVPRRAGRFPAAWSKCGIRRTAIAQRRTPQARLSGPKTTARGELCASMIGLDPAQRRSTRQ